MFGFADGFIYVYKLIITCDWTWCFKIYALIMIKIDCIIFYKMKTKVIV